MAKRPFTELPQAINMIDACIEGRRLPMQFGDGFTYEVFSGGRNCEVHRVTVDLTRWEEPKDDKVVALSLCPEGSDTPYNEYKLVRLRRVRGQTVQPGSDGTTKLLLEAHTTIGFEKTARVIAQPDLVFCRTEGQRRRRRTARIARTKDGSYRRSPYRYSLA